MKEKNKEWGIYLLLIVLTIITVIPLFVGPVIRGDDYFFHLLRIEDIKNGILCGHFPVNIMPESLYGYGYANGIFYPDILLYIPAILRILGINLKLAYGIFMLLCTLASTFAMYICSKKIVNNKNIALYSTVIYIFGQYKIADLYLRSAVGEYMSFIFIPIVLLGVYELIYKNYKKWYILAIGMTGVILSHLLSVFLVIILCVALYLLNIKNLIKEPKRIGYSFLAAIVTLLLTCYTWMPILEQFAVGKFSMETADPFAYDRSISIEQLFKSSGDARFFIGFVILIGAVSYIYLLFKKKGNKFITTLFIIGIVSVFLTIQTPVLNVICEKVGIFNKIQFAWRMNLIGTPLLAIVSGYSIENIFLKNRSKSIIMILVVILSIGNLFLYTKYYRIRKVDFDNYTKKYSTYIGAGHEYLPDGVNVKKLKKRGNIVTSNDKKFTYSNYVKKGSYISFDYKVNKNDAYIELPLIYYKGYDFKILSKEGKVEKTGEASYGNNMLVKVNINDIKEGKLTVDYVGTKIMKISYGVSIITLIGLCIYLIKKKKNNNYINKIN